MATMPPTTAAVAASPTARGPRPAVSPARQPMPAITRPKTAALNRPCSRSLITTPWATYSFHPLEAVLLGNVILLPMVLHDFSLPALLALPIISLVFNNIGHSNYDFLPGAAHDRWWLNGARRHHLHHACYSGNFGFMLPFMDRWFGTNLPPDAALARRAQRP